MTNFTLKRLLFNLKFTAGMNARYHQREEMYWGRWDRGIRIAVGILAVFGLVFATPSMDVWHLGLATAIISLIAAAVLNILPVGDWEKRHGELFRLWSDLRRDAVLEEQRVSEEDDGLQGVEQATVRLNDLTSKVESLHANEPAPDMKLLKECEKAETIANGCVAPATSVSEAERSAATVGPG